MNSVFLTLAKSFSFFFPPNYFQNKSLSLQTSKSTSFHLPLALVQYIILTHKSPSDTAKIAHAEVPGSRNFSEHR